MRLEPECMSCLLAQTVRAGRIITGDGAAVRVLAGDVAAFLGALPGDISTPRVAALVYERIRAFGEGADPYAAIKERSTAQALALYPRLKDAVTSAADPLAAAIRIAIAGNVIDYGTGAAIDLDDALDQAFGGECVRWEYDAFVRILDGADEVLYLGDNAGETVFDRVLIETLGRPVTYAVREVPVINDATMVDALAAGLNEVATVVSSGTTAPGTVLELCDDGFVERFRRAPLVISKGQGNYEALAEESGPLFFMLKAKCPVIAGRFGIGVGGLILAHAGADGSG